MADAGPQQPSDDTPTTRGARDDLPTTRGMGAGQRAFGRYTLQAVAGRGGMGVVWRAHDEELGETVALKFLPEVVAGDAVAVDELREETRRARRLTHPHIVRIHDFLRDDANAAVSMEFVAGTTLGQLRLDQPGKVFAVEVLAPLVSQLCAALDYAHVHAKIVHRDLKPANLLVTADGQLKVTDFGISRSLSETATRLTSKAGGTSGTLLYMSPQQLSGDKPTAADDLYALGATLYELLTGKPPFYRGDAHSLMKQVAERVPLALAAQRAELEITGAAIPAHWEQTILACLAKEPAQRPASAGEVARRLKLGPEALPPPGNGTAVTGTARSRRPLYAALAALVLFGIGGGYYFSAPSPEQHRREESARAEAEKQATAAARQRDEQAQAEAARLRDEQERAAATAKAKAAAEAEQRALTAILAKIDAVADSAAPSLRAGADTAVREYLANAPAHLRGAVETKWTQRLAAWETARQAAARGSLRVRTEPSGAEVTVGPLGRGLSPLTIREAKPGKYPATARLAGYDDWSGTVEIVANETAEFSPRLARSTGDASITSQPAGLSFTLSSSERTERGVTPATLGKLPTGTYTLTIVREGWPEEKQTLNIARYTTVNARADFPGGELEITSEPSGPTFSLKGGKSA